ncbi:unnamed protein product, partial [Tuber aestivum]
VSRGQPSCNLRPSGTPTQTTAFPGKLAHLLAYTPYPHLSTPSYGRFSTWAPIDGWPGCHALSRLWGGGCWTPRASVVPPCKPFFPRSAKVDLPARQAERNPSRGYNCPAGFVKYDFWCTSMFS